MSLDKTMFCKFFINLSDYRVLTLADNVGSKQLSQPATMDASLHPLSRGLLRERISDWNEHNRSSERKRCIRSTCYGSR
jgi:hypothetical protein